MKSFCFFGHVDSGKSTCAGHLLALCGDIDEHELSKIKKDCYDHKTMHQIWSNVLDINDEERIKGKTHEFNIIELNFNNQKYNMIDLPGHKMFIREMISGISYFETNQTIGCLVISAYKGEFESGWLRGQTKEDIIIARSLDIKHLIILINKLDSQNWNKEIYDNILIEIEPFIKNFCGFKNYYYIPISGYQGIGLIDRKNLPDWYNGKSLMETIENINIDATEIIEELPLKEFNVILGNITILWCNNIIPVGFECIIHFSGNEYEAIFDKINKQNFIKKGKEPLKVKCIIKTKNNIKYKNPSRRFIIRDSNNTIGFGIIEKVNLIV